MSEPIERTLDNVLGQQVMGDFRPSDLITTATALTGRIISRPAGAAKAALGFLGDLGLVASGEPSLAPAAGDRRFTDPSWRENSAYAGLLQGHLAFARALRRYAQVSGGTGRQAERIEFLLGQVADALAPTNFLLGNPAALRRARETRGRSLFNGLRNLLGDVAARRPIPSQVDSSAFTVGSNLACTPGAVVLRTEMFELIQYEPQTPQVHQRPMLIVPSIVNKFYVFDLAPGRSVIEHFVRAGFTVFTMVWRNPRPEHDQWGMAAYQDAIDTAIDATAAIRGVDDVNLWAVCGAGPVAVSVAGYHAATGQRKINSLMLVVSPLDTESMSAASGVGAFMDKDNPAMPERVANAVRTKRLTARDFTLLFAMLRANELIWHYWVNNYLMGESPNAFDVLYWNEDATGMTARFNHDFSQYVHDNPFVTPGALTMHGVPIADLAELGFDSYVLGARNDHLCRWQSVYGSAQLLGPGSRFILGNSGHIQTIVCPPGTKKASFSTLDDLSLDAEDWQTKADRHQGSWWDDCVGWTQERAGGLIDAPTIAGDDAHPPIMPAPGGYVLERG